MKVEAADFLKFKPLRYISWERVSKSLELIFLSFLEVESLLYILAGFPQYGEFSTGFIHRLCVDGAIAC